MSNCYFVWFSDRSDEESIRCRVLDCLHDVADNVQGTLGWNDAAKQFASGEVTAADSPLFTIELAIRPDEYFESETERTANRIPDRSKSKQRITEVFSKANTLLAVTPLIEDPDNIGIKLLSRLAESHQPSLIAVNSGELIYDAMGMLLYPRSFLPRRWTRLT